MKLNKLLVFAMFINILTTSCDGCDTVNSNADNNKTTPNNQTVKQNQRDSPKKLKENKILDTNVEVNQPDSQKKLKENKILDTSNVKPEINNIEYLPDNERQKAIKEEYKDNFNFDQFNNVKWDDPNTFGELGNYAIKTNTPMPDELEMPEFGITKDNYEVIDIAGDGSCFMRSAFNAALYRTFNNQTMFDDMIKNISIQAKKYENVPGFIQRFRAKDLITLLQTLNKLPPEKRTEALNKDKLNSFLNYSFRALFSARNIDAKKDLLNINEWGSIRSNTFDFQEMLLPDHNLAVLFPQEGLKDQFFIKIPGENKKLEFNKDYKKDFIELYDKNIDSKKLEDDVKKAREELIQAPNEKKKEIADKYEEIFKLNKKMKTIKDIELFKVRGIKDLKDFYQLEEMSILPYRIAGGNHAQVLIRKDQNDNQSNKTNNNIAAILNFEKDLIGYNIFNEQELQSLKNAKSDKEKQEVLSKLLNKKNNAGKTPLFTAVSRDNKDMVDVLIKAGADVNANDNNHNSIMHIAAFKENKDIIELLINNSANIANIGNIDGNTPIDLAKNDEIKQLLQASIKPDLNDNLEEKTIYLADNERQKDIKQDFLKDNFKFDQFVNVKWNDPTTFGTPVNYAYANTNPPPDIAQDKELPHLGITADKYKKISIKGDGSCFMRASFHAILFRAFENDDTFNEFIDNIKKISKKYKNTPGFRDRFRTNDLITLLNTLKNMTPKARLANLNKDKTDAFLDYTFRSFEAADDFSVMKSNQRDEEYKKNTIKNLLKDYAFGSHNSSMNTLSHFLPSKDIMHHYAADIDTEYKIYIKNRKNHLSLTLDKKLSKDLFNDPKRSNNQKTIDFKNRNNINTPTDIGNIKASAVMPFRTINGNHVELMVRKDALKDFGLE